MSVLTTDIAPRVIAACEAGAVEAGEVLTRALGQEVTLTVGAATTMDDATALAGPAVAILWTFGGAGMAAVLPQWFSAPGELSPSRLATLAQELGALLAPENLPLDKFEANYVDDVSAALSLAEVQAGAALVPLDVVSGEQAGRLSLVWPMAEPANFFSSAISLGDVPNLAVAPGAAPSGGRPQGDLSQLPNYSRSLLKIRVPICVQLASKKELVHEVISLAPGSIIKFEKGCEELLQMIVGEHTVAEGEAVKVGEKFGFRVTSMLMPQEHFVPVKGVRRA